MGLERPSIPVVFRTDPPTQSAALSHLTPADHEPHSLKDYERAINSVLETPPNEFGRMDLGVLNLLCAPTLLGSEDLDISRCLARLDHLTVFVKTSIDRNLHRFASDPCYRHSEPMWRMAMLVTVIKQDFGASYSPAAAADLAAGIDAPFTDSAEVFIHGLLGDDPRHRWGTCASIPVLITAVARRLGYPVGLAVAGSHVFARWEGAGLCFNIEASNPAGMTSPSDEHYRKGFRGGLAADELGSSYYVRTLYPVEEFACFLKTRVHCLLDAARYEETLLWAARALQFAPDDPRFPRVAYYALDLAMKHRLWRMRPEQKIPPPNRPFFVDVGGLLGIEERSLHCTISAHHRESLGDLEQARRLLEDACRHNFYGNSEQRDLQRFLRKHRLARRTGPLLPPRNPSQLRRIRLLCKPEEEATALHRLADQLERDGELVRARDALHDLYMLDPSDAEVFQRAHALERLPEFQTQMHAWVAEHHQASGPTDPGLTSPVIN